MIKGTVRVVSMKLEICFRVEEYSSSTSVITAPELLCVSPHILSAEAETTLVNSDRVSFEFAKWDSKTKITIRLNCLF